jgi:flagellar biogenesis protein FliO
MNKEVLKTKWWYRLLQVVYALAFILSIILLFIFVDDERPRSTTYFPNSKFISQSERQYITEIAKNRGYSEEEIKIKLEKQYEENNNPRIYKTGSWFDYLKKVCFGLILLLTFTWIVRRVFLYIIIREKIFKL